jgi:hypothetical protein
VGYAIIQVGGLFIDAGSDKKALISSDEDCQGLQLSEPQDKAIRFGGPSFSPYGALFAILYSDDEPD